MFERVGVRVGLVGLVERCGPLPSEWTNYILTTNSRERIATVSSWASNFQYWGMKDVALELSRRSRDPDGEHKCDLVIAPTHTR